MASKFSAFLAELKRRKVYRAAALYAAVGVAIAVAIPDVFNALLLPDWAARLVIILILVGFPITLALAWAFEVRSERGTEEPLATRRAETTSEEQKPIASIAVLPLANLSGDPKEDYFSDGVTEALITDLARLDVFDVISRTSVMRYKGTELPLPTIAQELRVDAIVEGSVLRVGEEVRVTAQLIRGDSDTHIWAGSYDRKLDNILALQRDVTRAIVEEITGRLTPRQESRLGEFRPVDPEAHLAYLKGQHYRSQWTAGGFTKSIEEFEKAATIDPGYAPAHAEMALNYSWWGFPATVGLSPAEVAQRGKDAASKALEIDEESAEAHAALAMISFTWDWDWAEAERRFRRSIEVNPNQSTTQHLFSHFLVAMGRFDESLEVSRRALQLNPLDVEMNVHLAWHHQMAREDEQALVEARKAVAIDPDFHEVYWILGLAHLGLGELDQAVSALEKAAEASGRIPFIVSALGHAYGIAGMKGEGQAIVTELHDGSQRGYVSGYNLALVHTGLGDFDQTHVALQAALEARDGRMAYLATEPRFDPFRLDPHYAELVRRLGLPGQRNT